MVSKVDYQLNNEDVREIQNSACICAHFQSIYSANPFPCNIHAFRSTYTHTHPIPFSRWKVKVIMCEYLGRICFSYLSTDSR